MSTDLCPGRLMYLPDTMKRGNVVLCAVCQKPVKIVMRPYPYEPRFTIEKHTPKGT